MTSNAFKKFLGFLAQILTVPTWLHYKILLGLIDQNHACIAVSQQAACWTGMEGIFMRRALYKRLISKLGEDVSISYGTILTKPSIEIEDNVYIGSYGVLGNVRIGKNTLISDHVCIPSGGSGHGINRIDIPVKDQPEVYKTITIGTDCWVGIGSIVMANLGDHCVVGAGSVVTHPVPDFCIVAGNPAKPIGDRRDRSQN